MLILNIGILLFGSQTIESYHILPETTEPLKIKILNGTIIAIREDTYFVGVHPLIGAWNKEYNLTILLDNGQTIKLITQKSYKVGDRVSILWK